MHSCCDFAPWCSSRMNNFFIQNERFLFVLYCPYRRLIMPAFSEKECSSAVASSIICITDTLLLCKSLQVNDEVISKTRRKPVWYIPVAISNHDASSRMNFFHSEWMASVCLALSLQTSHDACVIKTEDAILKELALFDCISRFVSHVMWNTGSWIRNQHIW